MKYYIYENWQAGPHKAIVHAVHCPFCNDGNGRSHGMYDPKHGAWHGPFASLEDAHRQSRLLAGVVERHDHSCVAPDEIDL